MLGLGSQSAFKGAPLGQMTQNYPVLNQRFGGGSEQPAAKAPPSFEGVLDKMTSPSGLAAIMGALLSYQGAGRTNDRANPIDPVSTGLRPNQDPF
jgi:hypothetical protein